MDRDIFTHPSESNLIFEGCLTNADGTAYVNAHGVALTNNAIMHLFSRIECHLSNQLIESVNYPGQETTMLGLPKYPDDFSKAQGFNQLWYKDTATTAVKPTIMDLLQCMHISSSHQPSLVPFLLEFKRRTSLVFVRTMTKLCMA